MANKEKAAQAIRAALVMALLVLQMPQQSREVGTCADNLFKQWVREGKVDVLSENGMGKVYDDARRYCAAALGVEEGNEQQGEELAC